MFDNYNIESEYEAYNSIVKELIDNRQTLLILKEALDRHEELEYTNVHLEVDANGKPLYKNEELRKIAVNDELRKLPAYSDYQKQKLINAALELRFQKQVILLDLLKQEREFQLKLK